MAKKITKNQANFITLTFEEFVNALPASYKAPIYQRDYDASAAGKMLANMIYIALSTEITSKNMLGAGNVVTTESGNIEGSCFYPQPIFVCVEAGVIVAVIDGQHRMISIKEILNGNVRVALNSNNTEIDELVCRKYGGQKFRDIDKKVQNAIKNMVMLVYEISAMDLAIQKALFFNCNCGTSISTTDSMKNNFCDTAIYKAVDSIAYQLANGIKKSNGYSLTDGYLNIQKRNSMKHKTAFHIFSRCLAIDSSWGNTVTYETKIFKDYKEKTPSQVKKILQPVLNDLCFSADIVGHNAPIHLLTGMYKFVSENPLAKTWIKNNKDAFKKRTYAKMADFTINVAKRNGVVVPTTIVSYLSDTSHEKARTTAAFNFIEEVVKEMGCTNV